MGKRGLLLVATIVAIFLCVYYFRPFSLVGYPSGMSSVDKAALKAARIQEKELAEVTPALSANDGNRIIYGDRFIRWTVLAYTLYKIDQGDLSTVGSMENLMISYYQHAWYPNVKKRPQMPSESLISYLRSDGSWEDYWHDYKPVYVAAYVLEYYLLTCLDQEWGINNYPMLKSVVDSIQRMWLPDRHQPTTYVDAQGSPGTIQVTEIKNIACSVDSPMVYSALVSAAR